MLDELKTGSRLVVHYGGYYRKWIADDQQRLAEETARELAA